MHSNEARTNVTIFQKAERVGQLLFLETLVSLFFLSCSIECLPYRKYVIGSFWHRRHLLPFQALERQCPPRASKIRDRYYGKTEVVLGTIKKVSEATLHLEDGKRLENVQA